MNMKTSKKGIKHLMDSEGDREYAYLCSAKVPTISIGVTLETMTAEQKKMLVKKPLNEIKIVGGTKPYVVNGMVDTITAEQSAQLFAAVLLKYEGYVNKYVTVELKQHEFDALVSLVYNIGEGNFRGKKKDKQGNWIPCSVLRNINNKVNYTNDQMINWFRLFNKISNNGVLEYFAPLDNRRKKEANLFLNGVY